MLLEMYDATAQGSYGFPVNVRWTLCQEALGRKPKTWEFMAWIGQRWTDYGRMNGVKVDAVVGTEKLRQKLGADLDVLFDSWLLHSMGEGLWRSV